MKKKKCKKCKILKSITEFHKHKVEKDGYRSKCKLCRKQDTKNYYNNNKDKVNKASKRYYDNNRETLLQYKIDYYNNNRDRFTQLHKEYYENNKEYILEHNRLYRCDNKDKIAIQKIRYYYDNKKQIQEYKRNHYENNKEMYTANSAKRRSAKLKQTPKWVDKEHLNKIEEFYRVAQIMMKLFPEEKYHVDHIEPLQGLDVRGLHVWWNLQILLAEDNLKKSNKSSNNYNISTI